MINNDQAPPINLEVLRAYIISLFIMLPEIVNIFHFHLSVLLVTPGSQGHCLQAQVLLIDLN